MRTLKDGNNDTRRLSEIEMLEQCTKIAVEMALSGNPVKAVDFVSDAFRLVDAPFLSTCVNQFLLRALDKSEQDVYKLFKKNYKMILGPECEIVKIKNNPKHIPDFWVKMRSVLIPVECKVSCFDKKALRQLMRYMEFYKCSYGIAVGERFTCTLPDSITPITIGQLKSPNSVKN